jgi:exopolyphosphatase/pppGpp-phosphohydrolase
LTRAEARTVAFMDLGTNSIRLLLVRIQPDYSYAVLTQLKQMVRLGEGAFTHQHLQPHAIDRAVCVARQFARPRSRRRPLSATQHHPATSLVGISWHCNEL